LPDEVAKVLKREGWVRAAFNDVLKRKSMSLFRENQLRDLLGMELLPEDSPPPVNSSPVHKPNKGNRANRKKGPPVRRPSIPLDDAIRVEEAFGSWTTAVKVLLDWLDELKKEGITLKIGTLVSYYNVEPNPPQTDNLIKQTVVTLRLYD